MGLLLFIVFDTTVDDGLSSLSFSLLLSKVRYDNILNGSNDKEEDVGMGAVVDVISVPFVDNDDEEEEEEDGGEEEEELEVDFVLHS